MNTIEHLLNLVFHKTDAPTDDEGNEIYWITKEHFERLEAATKYQSKPSEPVGYISKTLIEDAEEEILSLIRGEKIEPHSKSLELIRACLAIAPQPKPAPDELPYAFEEFWDMYSEHINNDPDSFSRVLMSRKQFMKAAQACAAIAQSHTEAAVKSEAVGFAEWKIEEGWELWVDGHPSHFHVKRNYPKSLSLTELYDLYQASKTK